MKNPDIKKLLERTHLKIIILFSLLFMSFTYNDDIFVSSTSTQDELFARAQEWVSSTFNPSLNEIQMRDKNANVIIFNSRFQTQTSGEISESKVNFTMKIQVRQGRFKYWIYNLNHVSNKPGYSGGKLELIEPKCGTNKITKKEWERVKKQAVETLENYIVGLKKYMEFKNKSHSDC